MRRADARLKTETRARYESPRRQERLAEIRAAPGHQWILEVARGELEEEAVLVEDPEFLVLPDTRKRNAWAEPRCVNLLVIFRDMGLRTLRDLDADHLPALERVREGVLARVEELTGAPRGEVYCYFNYLPSNPVLLHLHLAWPLPSNRDSLRHHLLDTVIFNLQLCPTYYRDCPLAHAVPRAPRWADPPPGVASCI